MRLCAGEFLGRQLRSHAFHGLTLTFYEYQAQADLPLHSHEHAYLSFPLTGAYEERCSGATRACSASRAVYHPRGETHADRFGSAGARIFSIEIGDAWVDQLRDVGVQTNDRIELAPAVFARARRLFRRFAEARESLSGLDAAAVDLLATFQGQKRDRGTPSWIRLVRECLNDSLSRPSLASLAVIAGVHEVHLARTFRATQGCTIGEYYHSVRIARALDLLRDTHRALADIALACGYADQSHLSRDVKCATGITPAQLRRR